MHIGSDLLQMQQNDAIGSDLLQMQQNMCYVLINEMKPLMAPLLSFVPAQAHVMYGLLLSPRYKELRERTPSFV